MKQPELSNPFPLKSGQVSEKVEAKKTTDELIEEYERKINKTIKLLEEEKKKTINKKGANEEN